MPKTAINRVGKTNHFTMRKILYSIGAAFLLTSCAAYHSGTLQNAAALGHANFTYVHKDVKGIATCTYILGIGGLAKDAIASKAKQALIQQHPLKDNQALANITVNYKSIAPFYIIGILYRAVTCTITADIVEFKN